MPDSLYNWFKQIFPNDSIHSRTFKLTSSNGAVESIKVSRDIRPISRTNRCDVNVYFGSRFYYESSQSNQYWYSFNLLLDYEYEAYPNGWQITPAATSPDNIQLKISYVISTRNRVFYFLDLAQPVYNKFSTTLQAIYFTHAKLPAVSEYITCDTCIQYIGAYTQNGRTYHEVWRYINPLYYGNENTQKEFLIDKKYGVIGFKTFDNTSWDIDVF